MNNFLSGLLAHLSVVKGEGRSRLKRPLHVVAFIAGVLLFSTMLVFLLVSLEDYLDRPLGEFTTYAYLIVFSAALISSATIIFPAPGVAITMAAATQWDPTWVALVASVGSTLGEVTAYLVGLWGRRVITREYSGAYLRAARWMSRYGWVGLTIFSFVPILIFDIAAIVAGALRFPLWKFMLATYAGRLPRSIFEAYFGFQILPFVFPSLFG